MKIDRLVIFSVVLLAIGIVTLAGNWNGTISFHAALPTANNLFEFNVTNKGASALFGVLFTLLGLVTLVVTFFKAIFNLTSPRKTG